MRNIGCWIGIVLALALARPAEAEPQAEQPTVEALMKKIDALQRRLDQVEDRQRADKPSTNKPSANAAHHTPSPQPVVTAIPASTPVQPYPAAPMPQAAGPIPGLLPPEPMGNQYEGEGGDALRSDLPGLSLRIPGSQSEVRFYGFANLNTYRDLNGRNQTDAPTVQTIPLAKSLADMQGGDFGLSARFSRIGIDTRTAIDWGTLETRVEGDFGGGAPAASTNAVLRLRQAWAEFGTEQFRVLVGWANSLWNEGVYETVNFATNLNQSFVRQPEVRATATLAPGLTGQVSLEMPDTQYTSVAGVFTQTGTPIGFSGLSPSFTSVPDLLGRLEYRNDGLVLDMRTLLRDLTIRTDGTAAAPPAVTRDAAGWGVAGTGRFPMRWLSNALGPDELIGMAYYGEGIGRYFGGNTFGQDALSNVGLPGVADVTLDPLPTYERGLSPFLDTAVAQQLRLFLRMATISSLRATFRARIGFRHVAEYNHAAGDRQPDLESLRGNTVGTGWLDVGLEYVYSNRAVFGGTVATSTAGDGFATGNRVLGSVTARF
jgi:hypothetical protein